METGTFNDVVNNLGAGPSPKYKQRNFFREPSHLKRTNLLDCLFNGTQK